MNYSDNELSYWERREEFENSLRISHNIEEMNGLLSQGLEYQMMDSFEQAGAAIVSQELREEMVTSRETIRDIFKLLCGGTVIMCGSSIMKKMSINKISSNLEDMSHNLENIFHDLEDMSHNLNNRLVEIAWQIEQSQHVNKEILDVLMAPLDTQAKELRKRASTAYEDGLYEDALIDFQESAQKNRYDFMVHMTMGMIYTFHVVDREKALRSFELAVKYAKPKSIHCATLGILYQCETLMALGRISEAEKVSAEAIKFSPEFLEAHYQNARCKAVLGKHDESCKKLSYVIDRNFNYLLRAINSKLFKEGETRQYIEMLVRGKRDVILAKARRAVNKASFLIDFLCESTGELLEKIIDSKFLLYKKQAKIAMERNSLIDALKYEVAIDELDTRVLNLRVLKSNIVNYDKYKSLLIEVGRNINHIDDTILLYEKLSRDLTKIHRRSQLLKLTNGS